MRLIPSTAVTGTASPSGLLLNVTSVANPGQDLDAPTSATYGDEGYTTDPPLDIVTIIAVNTSGVDVILHVQWGGSGAAFEIRRTITATTGFNIVIDREPIGHGQRIGVWAGTTGVINVKMAKWPYSGPYAA